MRYNLACYECQFRNLKGAVRWLAQAIELAGSDAIKKQALDDPHLEPLWSQMGEI